MKISRMILRRISDLWVGRAGRHDGFHGRNNCFLIAFNFYIYTIFQNKIIVRGYKYIHKHRHMYRAPTHFPSYLPEILKQSSLCCLCYFLSYLNLIYALLLYEDFSSFILSLPFSSTHPPPTITSKSHLGSPLLWLCK